MTKEKVIGLLTLVFAVFKPLLFKWWNEWVVDKPRVELFFVRITFGQYHKEARRKEQETREALQVDLNNDKIDDLIAELGIKLDLNRATVEKYKWVGNYTFPEKPEIQDFVNVQISIINEWTSSGIQPIMKEWQNRSGDMFAKALYLLHYSEKGHIMIGPDDEDDLTEPQYMFNINRSWRFKMFKGAGIFDGLVVLSVMYGTVWANFTEEQIKYIKLTVRKINEAKNSINITHINIIN